MQRFALLIATCLFLAAAVAEGQNTLKAPGRADGTLMLPAQTPIALLLETHLSTRDNKYGDGFAARVTTAVNYNGQVVIPEGSIVEGHVVRLKDARPAVANSELTLRPDLLSTPDGRHYIISAEVIAGDPLNDAAVDNEGTMREPRGPMEADIHHGELMGGGGVVAGAVLAGVKGALIAGGVGVVAASALWLVRPRHVVLNPGSKLTVRLDRPIQLSPATALGQTGAMQR